MATIREWKPGDVGVNLRWGYRGMYVASCTNHGRTGCWHNESGAADPGDDERRPLVVIDPEDREQVERLRVALVGNYKDDDDLFGLVEGLREFTKPTPRIEEPTGYGAVVEAADGEWWVLVYADRGEPRGQWARKGCVGVLSAWRDFADINVVRVLSEGVPAEADR